MSRYVRVIGIAAMVLVGCTQNPESTDQRAAEVKEEKVEIRKVQLNPQLASFITGAATEFDQIPPERREKLLEISRFVGERERAGEPSQLTFICTHNSRRSHMSQLWAQTAASYYGIEGVSTFSGGTEATAFNPRAVASIERAGFSVDMTDESDNPVYAVRYAEEAPAMECFSKVYDQEPNPKEGFAAIMTCSAADKSCPIVFGAAARIAIPFDDPKAFDGTEQESAKYDERCRQIAREMLFAFSQVRG